MYQVYSIQQPKMKRNVVHSAKIAGVGGIRETANLSAWNHIVKFQHGTEITGVHQGHHISTKRPQSTPETQCPSLR